MKNFKMNTAAVAAVAALSMGIGAVSAPVWAQGGAAAKPASKPRAVTGTAAVVNGEKIPNADVERQLDRIKAAQAVLRTDSPEARKALAQIRGNVLEGIIDWRLEVQEARRQKITPTPARVDEVVAKFRENFKTDAEMKAQLAKEGKSLSDFRLLVTEGLMVNDLEAKWTAPVNVSEAEAAQFYRDNITAFTVPEGVRARHILVGWGKQNPAAADKARAKTKADGLANQARAQGADFGLLARENSDEPVSKARGGDLGPQARGALEAAFGRAFEEAAFKTKVGEVSAPIESPFGFHVLKVDEKFTPRTLPLTEVRQLILDQMLPVKREEAVAEKMTALRKAAKITKTP